MESTVSVNGLTFDHILTATEVDELHDENGAVVRYQIAYSDLESMRRGVYIIVEDGHVVYVGKFSDSFSRRWLYTNLEKIYHHKRNAIAQSLHAGRAVRVYAQTEEALRSQIAVAANDLDGWINISGIETALIRKLTPVWNSVE